MEHDTSDQSPSDIHHGNAWRHQSLLLQSNNHDTSTVSLEKSTNLQIDNNTINRINNTTTSDVVDKHNRSNIDDDEVINARKSPDMISDTRCEHLSPYSPSDTPAAPSMPLALSDEAMLPQIRFSQNTPFPLPLSTALSTDGSGRLFDGRRNGDSFNNNKTSLLPLSISASNDDDRLFGGSRNQDGPPSTQINKEIGVSIPLYDEEEQSMHDTLAHESISNSKCVPVEGKLADLSDNESSYSRDNDDDEEGGIVILDESKEEDEQSIHTSIENRKQCIIESQAHNSQTSSMWEHDTILLDETTHMNANLLSINNNNNKDESLTDFEQLLNQAGDNQVLLQEIEEDIDDEHSENDRDDSTLDDNTATSGMQFWQLNPFSSSNRNKKAATINNVTTPSSRHNTPIRSTRIRHDKFVIEVDITSDDNNTRLDTRDVLDIMANIELLHLWFDPVPAVFEILNKDGSEAPDNSTSIENDVHHQLENNHNREYDGQWVEISTPPLTIPSDSRISGYMRAVRVGMRSLIGFPVRIKSMIFVERSCGRIGMTLGPYPDGYLCTSGTTAYHTFTIRQRDDEESNDGNRKCVVISDEVRLQRDVDSDFNGTVRNCCVCTFVRFIFGFLNVLFRWYQPDLASYMQQTISSMEKLRSLVERGESAAYSSSGEVIIDGDHGSEVGRVDETPLLGN